jgi:phosphatidate cytidylyltransferase
MLAQRLVAAAVGIPIILAVTLIGGPLFTAVAALILALAALEFVHMLGPTAGKGPSLDSTVGKGPSPDRRPVWQPTPAALVAMAAVAAIAVGADNGFDYWTGALVAGVGLALLYILAFSAVDDAPANWQSIVGAVAYVGFLGSYLILVRDLHNGEHWLLLAVLGTWATDTSAYAVGKAIGRNKMAPRISPGKTWEGTAGALVGGLIAVPLLNWPLDLPMSTGEAILLGALLPPVAVLADLGESMLKRGAGVKDTSELIPGHGGFLDRLDSILFTVPLVYYFAIWAVL